MLNDSPSNCTTSRKVGYGTQTGSAYALVGVYTCDVCETNYVTVANSVSSSSCGRITYNTCEYNGPDIGGGEIGGGDIGGGTIKSCTKDSTCGSPIETTSTPTTGYVKYSRPACIFTPDLDGTVPAMGTCGTAARYKCDSGYYGTAASCTTSSLGSLRPVTKCSGCTRCPSIGGVYGTSARGALYENDCYVESGTEIQGSAGTYQYTSSCYYQGCSATTTTIKCLNVAGTVGELSVPESTTEGGYCWCCRGDKCTYARSYNNPLYGDAANTNNCKNNTAATGCTNICQGADIYNILCPQ